jgi:hypothetical protein
MFRISDTSIALLPIVRLKASARREDEKEIYTATLPPYLG